MEGTIKVSVVVPLFNKKDAIKATINSVLNQSYSNFELVVVDDGSTDNSVETVQQYNDDRIIIFRKINGGPSSARNYGVIHSTGSWVLFLDADDILYPNALQDLISPLLCYDNIGLVCGNFKIDCNGKSSLYNKKAFTGIVSNKNKFKWIFQGKYLARAGAAIIQKKIVELYPFNEKLWRSEDREASNKWINHCNVYLISNVVMVYNNDYNEASKSLGHFDRDYVFHMDFASASFWERCILGNLYHSGLLMYPNLKEYLNRLYGKWDVYRYLYLISIFGHKIIRLIILLSHPRRFYDRINHFIL